MKRKGKGRGTHRMPEKIYSFSEADDRLYDIFRHHGFGDFPHDKRKRLVEFYLLLMNHQLTDNVTRLVKFRDIGIKHFIDSVIVPQIVTLEFPLLDVGTGPGFPGIPLKIMFPQEKIVLAEGVRRRVDFLKAVREEMKLENLDIVGRNIDETFMLPMKGVITRAVEEIPNTLRNVSQCLEIGGKVYFMKGPSVDPEIERAVKEWDDFFRLEEDHDYELPNSPNKRRLVVFKKIATPVFEPRDEEEE
jgi:16S rRNA (guanine527-N7)-methyltransferase